MGKLTLKQKKAIVKILKKHKAKKHTILDSGQMVAIPETEDAGGKPFFVSAVQFNKLVDLANRKR